MKRRVLAILLVGVMSLSLTACATTKTLVKMIRELGESDTDNSEEYYLDSDDSEEGYPEELYDKAPSGAILPDGTLKDSRLTEQQKPFVGRWESEDGHILIVREAAIASDGYTIVFPLDAIILFPYVKKEKEYEGIWDLVTRREEDIRITEEDGKLIFRDSQFCPNSNDPNDTSTHISTDEMEYDSSTDTITYRMLYNDEPASWEGADGYINHIVLHRTDKDIEEANWDAYYSDQKWRDPRYVRKQ